MKLRLNLNTKTWEISTPQSGSPDGWSQWEVIDRQRALIYIERGWTYETI